MVILGAYALLDLAFLGFEFVRIVSDRRTRTMKACIGLLQSKDPWKCRSAIKALQKMGPDAWPAVPHLVDAGPHIRTSHSFALDLAADRAMKTILVSPHPEATQLVPALSERLQSKQGCRDAAECLGRLGSGASGAVPALLQALKKVDGSTISAVVEALVAIGADAREVVPVLVGTGAAKAKQVLSQPTFQQ